MEEKALTFSGHTRGDEARLHRHPQQQQSLMSASPVASHRFGFLLKSRVRWDGPPPATRRAPAALLRAPRSAANTFLPPVWFRSSPRGFQTVLTFQLLIFLLDVRSTRS